MPTPSDQPVPSAAAANGLHRPSAARPRWRLKPTNTAGVGITVTPPASASSQSALRSACTARWIATEEEEQAVSMVTAGPSRPSVYAIRPETMLVELPVSEWPSPSCPDWARIAS
ncbi:hypothetical protein GCM10027186_58380 [Micromonospora schwarzwaldensis]